MARAVVRPDGTIAVDAPATPTGVSARRGLRGIVVTHNRSEGAEGYEVHVSTTQGFTPSTATLQGSGDSTIWTIPSLAPESDPEAMHYAKVIAYDADGNKSPVSIEATSPPGRLQAPDIPNGLITTAMMAAQSVSEFYSTGAKMDAIETLSDAYVPMPDMSLVVPIEQPCTIWYTSISPVTGYIQWGLTTTLYRAYVRLMIDNEEEALDSSWFTAPGFFTGYKTYGENAQYPFDVSLGLDWRLQGGDPAHPARVATASFRSITAVVLKR